MINTLFIIWLAISLSILPLYTIGGMLALKRWWPFDSVGEIFGIVFISATWPILIPIIGGVVIYQSIDERRTRLAEVRKAVEIHYQDQWYE